MHVELTVIHDEQQYTLNGEATISKFGDLNNDGEFIKAVFGDKTEDRLIKWQKQFSWNDKCKLETPTEVYEGLYKTHSRLDGSPIIQICETRILTQSNK